MRLLNCTTRQMKVWYGEDIPSYIILSHRWENEEDEVTLQDFESGTAALKYGYRKIEKLCEIAQEHSCKWVWLDTCCIDKRNAVELGEAINSMYKWYQRSMLCVAYLFDFRCGGHRNLDRSTWFRRCWTLQELIGPRQVSFYDKDWSFFGTKQNLCVEIAKITGIDEDTLSGSDPLRCSVAQRLSWAAGRAATRVEDEAYSLIGLFGLSLPMLYGDGEKAFMALQKEILLNSKDAHDQSIFAWTQGIEEGGYYGLLAKNVSAFAGCGTTQCTAPISKTYAFSSTGAGFQLNVPAIPYGMNTYLCPLECTSGGLHERDCMLLEKSAEDDQYSRVCRNGLSVVQAKASVLKTYPVNTQKKLYVQQIPRHVSLSMVHGFLLRNLELPDCTERENRNVLLRSRHLASIQKGSIPGIVAIPGKKWGTAGIVRFPQPKATYENDQIRSMKLGFDEDFKPACLLRSNSTTSDPAMRASRFFDISSESEQTIWSNDWLCNPGNIPDDLQYLSMVDPTEYGGRNSNFGGRKTAFRSESSWGHISVICYLRDCPPELRVNRLPRSGPGPWKIWTVEIQPVGSFYDDQRSAREFEELLPVGVVMTAAGLACKWASDRRRIESESARRTRSRSRIT